MLQNTGKLAGRTLFITGASRGIGKAIALKAARDGANVVIAAKTAEAHPKLPGTIYTAAEEIEAAGGKALACIVDVRDERQISDAVESAVQKFGGIDILVNNASAINLTGTLETPMKKVDLMLGINLRGTYLTLYFSYTMAKYGMSMCVLGMSEEFRGSIAVNALWPRTAIQTAAMDMLGGAGISKQCRKVDIIADAAYAILTKPVNFTGQFVIDDELLAKEGVTDFESYAVVPGHPLLPDFFLEAEPDKLEKIMEDHGATPAFKSKNSSADAAFSGPIGETFNTMKGSLNAELVKTTQGVYQFDLSGEHPGVWYIDLKNGSGSMGSGEPPSKADVLMNLDSDTFIKMFTGSLKPTMAFMSGKLKIKGDMALALKLEKLMAMMNKSKL
uniref:Hydroxysteroid dehydrogenase-like protein 2 n=1 Tax=Astyanax mexicanus TaxID=7994 RepID=W5K7X2_ASTMX